MANKRASPTRKGGIFAGIALALFICLAALQAVFSRLECQDFPTKNANPYQTFSDNQPAYLELEESLNLI